MDSRRQRGPRFRSGCLGTTKPRKPSPANPAINALQKGRASRSNGFTKTNQRKFDSMLACLIVRRRRCYQLSADGEPRISGCKLSFSGVCILVSFSPGLRGDLVT
jgi:hypothetical protein